MKITKRERLIRLNAEIYALRSSGKISDVTSHLCNAISILTKGTKLENDGKSIIESAYPDYFKQPD